MLKALLVLAGAALLVVVGVLGLAKLVLPAPGPDGRPSLAGASPTDSTVPATLPPGPPASVGGVLGVTGDNPGTFVVEGGNFMIVKPDQGGFPSQTRFSIWSGNDGLILDVDAEHGLFVDQGIWDGLNLFPDPGDCTFTLTEDNPAAGVARLAMSCPEVTNAQETATIAIQGNVDLPRRLAYPDGRYRSGGVLQMEGNLTAEMAFGSAEWGVFRQEFSHEEEEEDADGFNVFEMGEERQDGSIPYYGIGFHLDDEMNPQVTSVSIEDRYFTAASSCNVASESVAMVAPNTELMSIDIDCPSLTDDTGEVTVSLAGTLRVALHDIAAGLEFER